MGSAGLPAIGSLRIKVAGFRFCVTSPSPTCKKRDWEELRKDFDLAKPFDGSNPNIPVFAQRHLPSAACCRP